jgi:hypothetical protein
VKWIDVSTRLPWQAYLLVTVFAAIGVWVLVAPDRAWRLQRAFVGWQYRDGHRIELSTAGRLWTRFGGVVSLAVALWLCLLGVNWSADSRVETESRGADTVYLLGDPVESPGCTVRVVVCVKFDVVFPIEVTGYEAPAAGTELLVSVEDQFFPTHLVMSEQDDRVTVSLYGKCVPRYPWDPAYGRSASECRSSYSSSFPGRGLVPVSLDRPLAGRPVIDGSRGDPVERTPID